MKIGIDLDGVVIDSETTFRTYEEIFDNNYSGKDEDKEEDFKDYISNLIYQLSSDSISMGSGVTYEMIQEQYRKNIKHELLYDKRK